MGGETLNMPRILLTGFTRIQANDTDRTHLKYVSNPQYLYKALRAAGADVDWRPAVPGEDLSGYDGLIIGLQSTSSLGSKHAFGALWCVLQNMPKMFLFDDWNVRGVVSDLARTVGKPKSVFFKEMLPRTYRDSAQRAVDELMAAVNYLGGKQWNEPSLGSFYDWGDHAKYKEGTPIGELLTFDPSCYQVDYGIKPAADKERKWVLASLGDHTKWMGRLGLTWEIVHFGNRKLEKEGIATRLTEEQLMRVYERCWGVLSPKYNHAGSGWWRARFEFAAQAGCILLADAEEVGALGPAYTRAPRDIEGEDEGTLMSIAEDQAAALGKYRWSEDKLVGFARDLLSRLRDQKVHPILADAQICEAARKMAAGGVAHDDVFS
jgi:hypothetical protein